MQRPKPGMIWIKEGEALRPVRVRVGLTDGSFTEVKGRNLTEGAEVALGMNNPQPAQSGQQQQQNPFAPQRPQGGGRGGR